MHYGTFALGDDGPTTAPDGVRAELTRLGPAAPRMLVVRHGEPVDVLGDVDR